MQEADHFVVDDAQWLDHELCAFLGQHLTGGGKGVLNNVQGCRGFETWRRLVKLLNHSSEARRDQLYVKVHNPRKAI